jgi:hypothetical protein
MVGMWQGRAGLAPHRQPPFWGPIEGRVLPKGGPAMARVSSPQQPGAISRFTTFFFIFLKIFFKIKKLKALVCSEGLGFFWGGGASTAPPFFEACPQT